MNNLYKDICALFELNAPAPLPEEQIDDIKKRFGGLPEALEIYYRLCGGCEAMNSAQDYLLTADGRYRYNLKKWNYDNYCVFYVENQCVSEWAFKKADIDKDDPPIYETYDNGKSWFETCDKLSQFLISHAYLHAALSFEYSSEEFFEAHTSQIDKIAEQFPHANADSQLYTGVKFYQPYPDTVIAIMRDSDNKFQVLFSSKDEEHFEKTADIIYDILGFEE